MKLNKGEAIVRANAKSVVLLTVCASVLACAAGAGVPAGAAHRRKRPLRERRRRRRPQTGPSR